MICVVGVYLKLSASTNIKCNYGTDISSIVQNPYFCVVAESPSIRTRESATITSVSGDHQSGKTNSDVEGFYVESVTIRYFPRGLEAFFKNIKVIQILSTSLKEVYQADLKPFPKLVELNLYSNLLEVLEEGLFDYNPDLEFISFLDNNIVHIEPKVFDNLSKLSTLLLRSNHCVDKDAENSTSAVQNLVQNLESTCKNSDFSSLKEKLEMLEKESKTINSGFFADNLLTFKKASSRFEDYRPINYKFEALLNYKIENEILSNTLNVDMKLGNMSDSMTAALTNTNDEIKSLKGQFTDLKADITATIDEKINGIEERLMKKFEELLEAKLRKFIG